MTGHRPNRAAYTAPQSLHAGAMGQAGYGESDMATWRKRGPAPPRQANNTTHVQFPCNTCTATNNHTPARPRLTRFTINLLPSNQPTSQTHPDYCSGVHWGRGRRRNSRARRGGVMPKGTGHSNQQDELRLLSLAQLNRPGGTQV